MSTNWQDIADGIWNAVLTIVKDRRAQGETLQHIASAVGVNNCSVIGEWLAGNRKAAKAPFATLMSYADNLSVDYLSFFPHQEKPAQAASPAAERTAARERDPECEELIFSLRQEVASLMTQLNVAHGEVSALERQVERLAPTPEKKVAQQ